MPKETPVLKELSCSCGLQHTHKIGKTFGPLKRPGKGAVPALCGNKIHGVIDDGSLSKRLGDRRWQPVKTPCSLIRGPKVFSNSGFQQRLLRKVLVRDLHRRRRSEVPNP